MAQMSAIDISRGGGATMCQRRRRRCRRRRRSAERRAARAARAVRAARSIPTKLRNSADWLAIRSP